MIRRAPRRPGAAPRRHRPLEPRSSRSSIEHAVRRGEGQLAEMGRSRPSRRRTPVARRTTSSSSGGRETEADIDWGAVNRPIEPAHFDALLADVTGIPRAREELFVQDLYCGADPAYRLAVRYVSPSAWHMAFVRNMFIRRSSPSWRRSRRTSRCCTRRRCRPIRGAMAPAPARSSSSIWRAA
jgi:ATP-dependent phosphoenolpyruvate carboxykinase